MIGRIEIKITEGDYDYFCELKLDGLTIVLTYENGILKMLQPEVMAK